MTALLAALLVGAICELPAVQRDADNVAKCMACHDGGVATAIGDGDAIHMIGGQYHGSYGAAWLGRSGLKALPFGSPIVLHRGQVTCTSCHDPQSSLPKKVAAGNICVHCHEK